MKFLLREAKEVAKDSGKVIIGAALAVAGVVAYYGLGTGFLEAAKAFGFGC